MPEAGDALRVAVARSGETALIRLDGELDCASALELEALLRELHRGRDAPTRIVFDAEHLMFVDVAGIRPLVQAAHALPGAVSLRNASPKVLQVVRLLQYDELLGIDV
jgi:anti-anti-sigma factor